MSAGLAGRRILVVEDEPLIAMHIEDILLGLGCIVVGPAGRLDAAVRLAAGEALDAAFLDVNIRGGATYPVADLLRGRGIPLVFASGYGSRAMPPAFRDLPRLQKPFHASEIEDALDLLLPGLPR